MDLPLDHLYNKYNNNKYRIPISNIHHWEVLQWGFKSKTMKASSENSSIISPLRLHLWFGPTSC